MSDQPITNVEDAVAALGALPMPSGPARQPLSAAQLAEIEARATAATPGPWCTDSWEIYQGTEYEPGISMWIGETCRGTSTPEQDRADAEFVAAARSDVPALVAELERFHRLELGDTDGRVSAACGDPEHPTWLRAKGDTRRCPWCRIAELERVIAEAPASYVLMDRARAEADGISRAIAPVQALREDDEFHLHHTYRVPRDLPGLGGGA